MIRAFVALALPDAVVGALVAAQAGLPAGRAVEAATFHLTLAFLGERPEPVVEDVHYALAAIRGERFALRLEGLGLSGEGRPRVLHVGVGVATGLSRLREKVVQAARDAGLPFERRRYRPHVTLARFNAGLIGEEAERVRAFVARGASFRAGPFEVAEFALMRSRLGRSGPIYETLAIYPLRAGGSGSQGSGSPRSGDAQSGLPGADGA